MFTLGNTTTGSTGLPTRTTTRRLARAAVPVVGLSLALAACGSDASTSTSTAAGGATPTKVAAVIKGLDNPFFQAMEDGVKSAATTAGVEATIQAAADIGDTTGQADKLTALAGQDFSCFVVNPISGTNLVQSLAQVSAAGSPSSTSTTRSTPQRPRQPG